MYVGPKDRPRRKDNRRDGRRKIYVGMDLHKDSLQMAIVDSRGRVESNSKIPNTFGDIDGFFSDIPKSSGIVTGASSVSEETFLRLRDSGFKPVLANPFRTKAMAHAKIKTDKIDAEAPAQMLRGGFIPYCHMPSRDILDMRHLMHAFRPPRAGALGQPDPALAGAARTAAACRWHIRPILYIGITE